MAREKGKRQHKTKGKRSTTSIAHLLPPEGPSIVNQNVDSAKPDALTPRTSTSKKNKQKKKEKKER
jgi:hypothetical protein